MTLAYNLNLINKMKYKFVVITLVITFKLRIGTIKIKKK